MNSLRGSIRDDHFYRVAATDGRDNPLYGAGWTFGALRPVMNSTENAISDDN
jgi:hypothetical protein